MILLPHTTMELKDVKIEESWQKTLSTELSDEYFKDLCKFIQSEHLSKKTIYPKPENVFRAFEMCPFEKVKVVILGQDPYHGSERDAQGNTIEQANGLSFAVQSGMRIPPSLKNIFKEIESDTGIAPTRSGDLSRWATQGVLLLNAILTVEAGLPSSHQEKGWEKFTDAVIRALSDSREHIVFLLWGNYAKQKGAHIDRAKHLVLEAPHPSPFSAHSGFFGCKHFSKTNAYLRKRGLSEIDWN